VLVDDHVAEIDAHAVFNAASLRDSGVAQCHLALHLDRTSHRVDDARKLGEQTVAGGLDNASAVLRDLGFGELAADTLQRGERAFLISPISRE